MKVKIKAADFHIKAAISKEMITMQNTKNSLNWLDPAKSVLLIVDIQERMMRVINEPDEVTGNTLLLMQAAKTLEIPIVATTQYVARIGELLPNIQAELNHVTPLDKLEFDCFSNDNIAEQIKNLPGNINTIIVCGIETHICIYQTVLGGLLKGYHLWVPADAVSSRTVKNYEHGLARIRDIGGVVSSSEMIIYEWLRKAGTPVFKELLPFLK